MKLQTLEQFQLSSGLPDRAVIWLLAHGKLAVVAKPHLMVDVDSIENSDILKAIIAAAEGLRTENNHRVQERLLAIVADFMDSVVDEAIAVAASKAK